ncbi:hypothetical protein GQ43DRAFT_430886 [Delitschia confertaspora ATCC 74209]|uniref:Uncharacterized protein n=1 Tax=Delitschia confertaspora ATCC 74209 TaxID=1513339 RepID=A0A9P4JML1_9PLEO|nr:hypothetical protein GQ43DRAFT_430886 [Delitschia confertaspora ATCC 74209]
MYDDYYGDDYLGGTWEEGLQTIEGFDWEAYGPIREADYNQLIGAATRELAEYAGVELVFDSKNNLTETQADPIDGPTDPGRGTAGASVKQYIAERGGSASAQPKVRGITDSGAQDAFVSASASMQMGVDSDDVEPAAENPYDRTDSGFEAGSARNPPPKTEKISSDIQASGDAVECDKFIGDDDAQEDPGQASTGVDTSGGYELISNNTPAPMSPPKQDAAAASQIQSLIAEPHAGFISPSIEPRGATTFHNPSYGLIQMPIRSEDEPEDLTEEELLGIATDLPRGASIVSETSTIGIQNNSPPYGIMGTPIRSEDEPQDSMQVQAYEPVANAEQGTNAGTQSIIHDEASHSNIMKVEFNEDEDVGRPGPDGDQANEPAQPSIELGQVTSIFTQAEVAHGEASHANGMKVDGANPDPEHTNELAQQAHQEKVATAILQQEVHGKDLNSHLIDTTADNYGADTPVQTGEVAQPPEQKDVPPPVRQQEARNENLDTELMDTSVNIYSTETASVHIDEVTQPLEQENIAAAEPQPTTHDAKLNSEPMNISINKPEVVPPSEGSKVSALSYGENLNAPDLIGQEEKAVSRALISTHTDFVSLKIAALINIQKGLSELYVSALYIFSPLKGGFSKGTPYIDAGQGGEDEVSKAEAPLRQNDLGSHLLEAAGIRTPEKAAAEPTLSKVSVAPQEEVTQKAQRSTDGLMTIGAPAIREAQDPRTASGRKSSAPILAPYPSATASRSFPVTNPLTPTPTPTPTPHTASDYKSLSRKTLMTLCAERGLNHCSKLATTNLIGKLNADDRRRAESTTLSLASKKSVQERGSVELSGMSDLELGKLHEETEEEKTKPVTASKLKEKMSSMSGSRKLSGPRESSGSRKSSKSGRKGHKSFKPANKEDSSSEDDGLNKGKKDAATSKRTARAASRFASRGKKPDPIADAPQSKLNIEGSAQFSDSATFDSFLSTHLSSYAQVLLSGTSSKAEGSSASTSFAEASPTNTGIEHDPKDTIGVPSKHTTGVKQEVKRKEFELFSVRSSDMWKNDNPARANFNCRVHHHPCNSLCLHSVYKLHSLVKDLSQVNERKLPEHRHNIKLDS